MGNRRKRCDWRIGGGTQEDGIGLEVEGGGDGLEATKYRYVSFRKVGRSSMEDGRPVSVKEAGMI